MNTSHSNWTGRTARTTLEALGSDGTWLEIHRPPYYKRALFAFVRHGWMVAVAVIAVLVLSGCVDMATEEADAASLRDAVQQARNKGESDEL